MRTSKVNYCLWQLMDSTATGALCLTGWWGEGFVRSLCQNTCKMCATNSVPQNVVFNLSSGACELDSHTVGCCSLLGWLSVFITHGFSACVLVARMRDTYWGSDCMVWAEMMVKGHTDSDLFSRGSTTATCYRVKILAPCIRLFTVSVGLNFIFMQDNVRVHTARLVQECSEGVTCMEWPARSPNLSPIEHLWEAQGDGSLIPPPRMYRSFSVPSELINALLNNMPWFCQACITLRGSCVPC